MTRVFGQDVYQYIANGFFICFFTFLLLLTGITCLTSLKRNRIQTRWIIVTTCILIALILMQKIAQLGFLVAANNMSDTNTVGRVFRFLADILINLTSRFTILFLAYIHVYILADNAFACLETEALRPGKTPVQSAYILEFNFPYLVASRARVVLLFTILTLFMLIFTVIPTIVLKLLVVILNKTPPNGLPAAGDGFQSFFDQMISINLGFILLFGAIFASKAIRHMISFESRVAEYQTVYHPQVVARNVMRKSMSMKRLYVALGYLAIFEFYNLFFEILTGRNVLLSSYIIVSLALVSALVNNRLENPKHERLYRKSAVEWYQQEQLKEPEVPISATPPLVASHNIETTYL